MVYFVTLHCTDETVDMDLQEIIVLVDEVSATTAVK